MRKAAVLMAAALLATGAEAADVRIGGYVDAGWYDMEGGGANAGNSAVADDASANPILMGVGSANGAQTTRGQATFALHEVNVDVQADLADGMSVFASVDARPTGGRADRWANAGRLTVDAGYVEWRNPLGAPVKVRAGAISSLVGIEQREIQSNQKRSVSLSPLSPYLSGTVVGLAAYGSWEFLTYQVGAVNYDAAGSAPGAAFAADPDGSGTVNSSDAVRWLTRNMPENNNVVGADVENSRVVQGRIGATPFEGLEVGLSGSIGKYAAPLATGDRERRIGAFDVSYAWGPWSVKGEYLTLDEDNSADPRADDNHLVGWYIEGAYAFASLAGTGRKGGLVGRYGTLSLEVDGDNAPGGAGSVEAFDLSQIVLGGWLDLTRDVRLKAEYQINDEDATPVFGPIDPNNDVFTTSLVVVF